MFRLTRIVIASATLTAALGLAATPGLSQETNGQTSQTPNGHVATFGVEGTRAPSGTFGIDATTPSRIPSSRREMNRHLIGGDRGFSLNMNRRETLQYAERVIRRGGFQCTLVEAVVVARSSASAPFVEVSCREGGGLVLSDTSPMQWTDCLDIPEEGYEISQNNIVRRCSLPGNVAALSAEPQSGSDNN